LNNANNINSDIPGLSTGYNRLYIGESMIQLILSSLLIPLVVILAIAMLILASPLIIGGLIYLNYQINKREKA